MYFEENGYQLGGRKLELIIEDSQARPEVALNKLRKYIESDQVDFVGGEAFAHIALAMAPKADEYKIPMIFPVAAPTTSPSACATSGSCARAGRAASRPTRSANGSSRTRSTAAW